MINEFTLNQFRFVDRLIFFRLVFMCNVNTSSLLIVYTHSSTCFLVGPFKQLKNMFHEKRLIATIIVIISFICTLLTAIVVIIYRFCFPSRFDEALHWYWNIIFQHSMTKQRTFIINFFFFPIDRCIMASSRLFVLSFNLWLWPGTLCRTFHTHEPLLKMHSILVSHKYVLIWSITTIQIYSIALVTFGPHSQNILTCEC